MKKLFYLYRMSLGKTEWVFDDIFNSYQEALDMARHNSKHGSWKTWKIEEIIEF